MKLLNPVRLVFRKTPWIFTVLVSIFTEAKSRNRFSAPSQHATNRLHALRVTGFYGRGHNTCIPKCFRKYKSTMHHGNTPHCSLLILPYPVSLQDMSGWSSLAVTSVFENAPVYGTAKKVELGITGWRELGLVIRFWVAGLCPKRTCLCLCLQPQEVFHSAAALLIAIDPHF